MTDFGVSFAVVRQGSSQGRLYVSERTFKLATQTNPSVRTVKPAKRRPFAVAVPRRRPFALATRAHVSVEL